MLRLCLLLCLTTLTMNAQWNLMPMPSSIQAHPGRMPVGALQIRTTGPRDARVDAAIARFRSRLAPESGAHAAFEIRISGTGESVQRMNEDEGYRLEITPQGATLVTATPLGAMHGLETVLQLVDNGSLPAAMIEDHPRFPWRGLHLDVSRHFMPLEMVKRNLDGMAAVKLNVFHWHLSDDQGFRVESKRYPKLQEKGSDGLFYTQDQIRGIVAYARDRGIRVVPEFDIPGHATSWLVGYPELSAGKGPFEIIRTWGIFDATLDPSNPAVYEFLDGFIGEMAGLFPDAYFHIGGDEVTGKQWAAKGLGKTAAVHAGFNQKVQQIVSKYGKRMEGWDEILSDSLNRDIVIQSWRGQKSLFEAARNGFSGILSAGYYLDHMETAATMYQVDPLNEKGRATGMLRNPQSEAASTEAPLTETQRAKILGGEICMWTEYVSPETVDSRIWPRTAAIAERFWSPESVTGIPDMYRRLDWISGYLDRFGLQHNTNYVAMLERLAGRRLETGKDIDALKTLADVSNPGDLGLRHRMKRDYNQQTPLNRFVDAARPDSPIARKFNEFVERYAANRNDTDAREEIVRWLRIWAGNQEKLAPLLLGRPILAELTPLSNNLSNLAKFALNEKTMSAEDVRNAKQPVAEVRLAVGNSLEKLNRLLK